MRIDHLMIQFPFPLSFRFSCSKCQKYLVQICLLSASLLIMLGLNSESVSAQPSHDEGQGVATLEEYQPTQVSGCHGTPPAASDRAMEDEAVYQVNQIRRQQNLPPLKKVEPLVLAARFHAYDMAQDNYFAHASHDRVDGQLVQSCNWTARISAYYPAWAALGENIGGGYANASDVVQAWMDSPGHRKNLLSTKNWEIGIGYYQHSSNFQHYWVQDFGRQIDVYPMIIDNEAPTTDSGDVTLYIYGDWSEVRLKLNGESWGPWQPFSREISARIEGDAGLHTLYGEFRSGENVANAQDEIYLSTSNRAVTLNQMPDTLDFIIDHSSGKLTPGEHNLSPLGEGESSYHWKATVENSWIQISPAQGGAGDWVKIAPNVSAGSTGNTSETVLITLYDQSGSIVDMHQIRLSLLQANQFLYLPTVSNDN